mmetsp:Transcript_121/g.139  ORF Transcript_121/g.139 Transcript_121/m.139 type:complete len:271 (+) Transcript_121:258-1070(+)
MSLVIKETRDTVTSKIKRLNDEIKSEIKRKNDEARAAKVQADNDLIRHKREERLAWFLQSVKRMHGSALAIDQHATEVKRMARVDEYNRRNLIRKNRNAILSGPLDLIGETTFSKGGSLFKRSSSLNDYVDPQKVTVSMSIQHRQTNDSLQLLQGEQRKIKKMLQKEFQEINLLFPAAISMASSPSKKPVLSTSQSDIQTMPLRSTSMISKGTSAFGLQSRSRSRQRPKTGVDTNLSTRFDSASVPLRLVRPQLPKIIKQNISSPQLNNK